MSNILRLKTHRSESEWREIYEEHVSKGITISSFCKSKGIALSSYLKWYRQFSGINNKSPHFYSQSIGHKGHKGLRFTTRFTTA